MVWPPWCWSLTLDGDFFGCLRGGQWSWSNSPWWTYLMIVFVNVRSRRIELYSRWWVTGRQGMIVLHRCLSIVSTFSHARLLNDYKVDHYSPTTSSWFSNDNAAKRINILQRIAVTNSIVTQLDYCITDSSMCFLQTRAWNIKIGIN